MNRKGFTLIELLAIIVILAIIAVITIPKITKITEKSRKDSASLSANGYIEAVEKYAMIESQNDDEFEMEGEFTILDGVLSQDSETYTINVNGTIPSNGNLVISEGDVVSGCITIGKYKVTISNEKVSNTSKGNCIQTYTITFDSNGGSEVASITSLSGRSITKPTDPTKNGTKFLGWYIDSELTNMFDFSSVINSDTTLYAKWGNPLLKDYTWAEIKENLEDDRDFYTIGDAKIISFDRDGDNINEYYKVRLINTSPCGDYTGSRTSCGVVFEFSTVIGTHILNPGSAWGEGGNVGGWKESSMRKYLNIDTGNIFSKLPSDLQNVIIGTSPIISGSGPNNDSADVVASDDFTGDKLFLLSSKEIGYSGNIDNKRNQMSILQYYSGDNISNLTRVKYSSTTSEGVDSSESEYWLRSADSSSVYSFYAMVDNSTCNPYVSNSTLGVAPAFRILD